MTAPTPDLAHLPTDVLCQIASLLDERVYGRWWGLVEN